jgi:hypothetical protein
VNVNIDVRRTVGGVRLFIRTPTDPRWSVSRPCESAGGSARCYMQVASTPGPSLPGFETLMCFPYHAEMGGAILSRWGR